MKGREGGRKAGRQGGRGIVYFRVFSLVIDHERILINHFVISF